MPIKLLFGKEILIVLTLNNSTLFFWSMETCSQLEFEERTSPRSGYESLQAMFSFNHVI
jgi:hypothetical protein